KALDGFYQNERTHYAQTLAKKAHPAAPVSVEYAFEDFQKGKISQSGKQQLAAVGLKDAASVKKHTQLNFAQFAALADVFNAQMKTTIYYNKIERLKYLVTPDSDGLLYDLNDAVFDMTKEYTQGLFETGMYAMDFYGNLFVGYEIFQTGKKFNHSTF